MSVPKIAWLAAAGVLASSAVFSQEAKRADAEERAAFEAVCGACHSPGMVNDLRVEADWKDTIEVMVKAGAQGSPEQFDLVLRYLLHNFTKVNVNTATAGEIAPVLAVSVTTAQAIVKRRASKGSFRNLDELKGITGVDAAVLESRKDRIVF